MTTQPLTLQVPEVLYRQLKQRAEQAQRSVEAETLHLLAATVPAAEDLPTDIQDALAALALLKDDELWNAARSRLASELAAELEELHLRRQRSSLTEADTQRLAELMRHYERVMLIRAQAAALLKARGQDVSSLLSS